MVLTFEVSSSSSTPPSLAHRKSFGAEGGTIGRLSDNGLQLPDPYVSARHAVIRHLNGSFYIEDVSINGVFVNTPDNRLVKGHLCELKNNDRIFINPYELRVLISLDAEETLSSHEEPNELQVPSEPAQPESLGVVDPEKSSAVPHGRPGTYGPGDARNPVDSTVLLAAPQGKKLVRVRGKKLPDGSNSGARDDAGFDESLIDAMSRKRPGAGRRPRSGHDDGWGLGSLPLPPSLAGAEGPASMNLFEIKPISTESPNLALAVATALALAMGIGSVVLGLFMFPRTHFGAGLTVAGLLFAYEAFQVWFSKDE